MHADPNKGGGVFCGPLRLLALEVYEQLNDAGNYCSLLTGQERKEIPFETHVSCTIEMVRYFFFNLCFSISLCYCRLCTLVIYPKKVQVPRDFAHFAPVLSIADNLSFT
jgi:hypothetical protein